MTLSQWKVCAWCGTEFARKPTYSNPTWAKVQCCSQSCGGYWRSQSKEYLAKLGAARRAYNVAHPDENEARLRKGAASKGGVYPSADPKKRGRSQALSRFKITPCEDCGLLKEGPRVMQRHHIDLNPLNNDPSNVAILCSACHGIRHRGDSTRTKRSVA